MDTTDVIREALNSLGFHATEPTVACVENLEVNRARSIHIRCVDTPTDAQGRGGHQASDREWTRIARWWRRSDRLLSSSR
jgi:hypothetical protein